MPHSLDDLRYQLALLYFIDDQTILQSDWMRGKTSQIPPKVVVLDPTLTWSSPCKKSKLPIDSFQTNWWLKNLVIWLDERQNSPGWEAKPATPNQKQLSQNLPSLDNYLHAKNLSYRLTPSRETDDQRILQYDWTRDTPSHTQIKIVISGAAITGWLERSL